MAVEDHIQSYIRSLIHKNSEWEPMVLSAVYDQEKVYQQVRKILCVEPETGEFCMDFARRPFNALYRAIHMAHKMRESANLPFQKPSDVVLERMLRYLSEQIAEPTGVSPGQEQELIQTLHQVCEDNPSENQKALVLRGVEPWLQIVRTAKFVNTLGAAPNWTAEEFFGATDRIRRHVRIETEKPLLQNWSDTTVDLDNMPPVMPCGILEIDRLLQGGFRRAETCLGLSAPSGGKTVTGLQIGTGMCLNNPDAKGVFISTEQPPHELYPRIVSARCDIPFNKIVNGIDPKYLSDADNKARRQLDEAMHGRFLCHHWSSASAETTLTDDLRDILYRMRDQLGGLDYVIFDWLGAAVTSKFNERSKISTRDTYKIAGEGLAELAKQFDAHIMFFAQVNQVQAKNKRHITADLAADCKALNEKTSLCFGISAMREDGGRGNMDKDKDKDNGDEKDPKSYKDEQCWFFDKHRKGVPRPIKAWRRFEYQRFEFEHERNLRASGAIPKTRG